jgi:predicted dehydrogenase
MIGEGTRRPPALRIGLVGYGFAGRVLHAPLIAATPDLRLTAVATRSAGRRAEARQDLPTVKVVGTANEVLAERPDAVVIATPNATHVPLASAALRAGAAVVVDKPLAATAHEASELVELANACGRLLTVFHNRRWDGDFLTIRRLVAEGVLGDVVRFESRFERWRPVPKHGWRRRGEPEEAGGLLYDLGSHLIDQALQLFGPVVDVYAEMDRRPDDDVDTDSFLALSHRCGVRTHLWMSERAAQAGPRFRVLGATAAYTKFGMDVQESDLRSGHTPGGPAWGEEESTRWGRLGTDEASAPVRTERGDYPAFYRRLAMALRGRADPPVDPLDAVAGLEIIERARRSAR